MGMGPQMLRAPLRYDTSLDRAGLALGVGSALAGALVCVLLAMGGARDPLGLAAGWLIGTIFSAIAIAAVAGPFWLAFHVAGLRRARHAALVGAGTALAIFVGAQTYGFGLFASPVLDSGTWAFRWLSALATSSLIAAIAAAISALMWRIAYRRYY
ncbi:hypothetical protein AB2M62_00015 [Sphingomonas sp. MMS12-HWE2-04]|uniref:hypothetical protein n=1 Tax=Sphingomonas sp. MMS12-HWE2-04 TaxID=3234199 RepID=UPI00384D001E